MRKNPLKHTKLFATFISVFVLIGSTNGNHVVNKDIKIVKQIDHYVRSDACEILKQMRKHYIVKVKPVAEIIPKPIKPKLYEFTITAYDLSFQSCQKSRGNSDYGITASGFDLRGHTLSSARVISVDPNIIPLGSKVRLTFKEDKYKKYNNIYTSKDTGGAIIGMRIYLFVGDFRSSKASKFAKDFGVTTAYAEIIE